MSLNSVINVGTRQGNLNFIYQSNLNPRNTFVDVEFTTSVWGNFDRNVGISTTAFNANLIQNGGNVTTLNILSVKQVDSEIEANASALVGGEMFVRVFIDINTYPLGVEEINLELVKDNIYNINGIKLVGKTENINLSPLPFAITGNDFIRFNFGESATSEGVQDSGLYGFDGLFQSGFEATKGSDEDGMYLELNESSIDLNDTSALFTRVNAEYLVFFVHKFTGNTSTPAEQGNIADMSGRNVFTYPFGVSTRIGMIDVGTPNGNIRSGTGQLTNDKEVIRYDLQSDKDLALFKDGVEVGSAGSYTPMRMNGRGIIGSATNPSVQNYKGQIYHYWIIKGNYTISEINSLQNYFETL